MYKDCTIKVRHSRVFFFFLSNDITVIEHVPNIVKTSKTNIGFVKSVKN